MNFALGKQDRKIIDQAVAAGMVRKIPAGVFGIDAATGLPYSSIEAAIAAHETTVRKCHASHHAPQDERDHEIMQCRRAGLSLRDTSAKIGMALSAVHRRFRKMRPGAKW
jgi:hypothetical protein